MSVPHREEIVLLYTTCESLADAKALAARAIAARLAACANILPGMVAVFAWEGAVREGGEVAMLLKTTRAQAPALTELMRAHHPYEVPCLLQLPVAGGHGPFLDWIAQQTTPTTAPESTS